MTSPSSGSTAGAGVGNAIKGAFQSVTGIGDTIRGNAMDFVDSALGTEQAHPESDAGRAKTEEGVRRMKGQDTESDLAQNTESDLAQNTGASTTAAAQPNRLL